MGFKAEDFQEDEGFAEYIKSVTSAAIEGETAELKSKIDEIIGEKRSLAEKMKTFEGLDLEKAKKAMKIIDENEYVKKLAEGKFDEVLAEKTDQLRTQHEEEMAVATQALETEKERAARLSTELDNTRIDAALRKAAIKAGVLADALEDIITRGRNVFSIGESGTVEARDKDGNIVKIEDKILTTARWIDTLPKHYWPSSESANLAGSAGGSTEMSEKLTAALKAGDMTLYRKLRKSQ